MSALIIVHSERAILQLKMGKSTGKILNNTNWKKRHIKLKKAA
jgi:hypothetical protein